MIESKDVQKSSVGRPLQLLSYNEKVKNENAWGKEVIDYYIRTASFGSIATISDRLAISNINQLYAAYNGELPANIFDSVTDPLKASQEKYKGFPAEIRPYNIIRPSIDLLIGEWNKRPFQYDVVNADGEDAFNSFEYYKSETYRNNVIQRVVNTISQQRGDSEDTQLPVSNPQTIMSELNLNYKDVKALKGYRALKVLDLELKLREVWRQLFKDWCIGGEVNTIKIPLHGTIKYLRLPAGSVFTEQSNLSKDIEDNESAVVKFVVSTSEIVDLFYDKIKEEDLKDLDSSNTTSISTRLFTTFTLDTEGQYMGKDKHDLFYITWKSKKLIGFLTYPDPFSGIEQYDIVDESYKVDKEAGESVEWMWVNEVWEGWRIGDDKYIGIQPITCQRNEMNNFSACKLPINGRKFSDTQTSNISIALLGMPYQILYIILMYRLELTIAKSKGKIVLLDKNVLPDAEDGGEEHFFYYAEALGYALVDPKKGAAGFNQYTVLDLSLFQHIQELIRIIEYVKAQWDELLGITRQRKGDITASDGLGNSEQAIFRSSVISDLIFTGFEEFLEKELSGLLDCSKYAWADGKKGSWRNDDGTLEMLSIEPDEYSNSSFGVYVKNISKYLDQFNALKSNINAIAQRKDVKTSTIVELITTESFTELKALVKKAEAAEQEIIKATAENEQKAKAQQEESQKQWEYFLKSLDIDFMEREWDRRDNNEYIKADATPKTDGTTVDLVTLQKNSNDRLAQMEKNRQEEQKNRTEKDWQQIEREKIASQERIAKDKNKVALKNKVVGEK